MRLPPERTSPVRVRRMLRAALEEAGLDELVDRAVLLGSELCDNAVLHAGTEFEVKISISDDAGGNNLGPEVTVVVTDRGPGPLELHLAMPRTGRAATHGRGLLLVERLATEWGTRHDANGRHQTWFVLRTSGGVPEPRKPDLSEAIEWPDPPTARWLLHVPANLIGLLELPVLASELLRRLSELVDAEFADVAVEYGDGLPPQELATIGLLTDDPELIEVRLPVQEPLRGLLRLAPVKATPVVTELAELTAQRLALSIESEWLRGADQRRRSWMSYLADTSELLAQSLDVDLTVAVVPQLLVPRLGQWSAVHLVDEKGGLQLASLTHAAEEAIPQLREALEATGPGQHRAQLAAMLRRAGRGPTGIGVPADSIAVALTARGQPLGTLTVGRGTDRPHSPEEIALISDLARRASLAIDNAQVTAAHIETSQALQQALLPRELPATAGVEFAAEYLPASTASDVGGDFYDVLTINDDRWLVSIGDVCGKGARAAARTGLVRDVLRVLVRDGRPLTTAIQLLNGVMLDGNAPEQFCTVAAAMVSRPATGAGLRVQLVLAGHEQPAVLRADGTVELLGEHGTAVGLVHGVQPTCTEHWLGPGDAMVTYTDGVTERRRGTELFGQERLVETLAAAAGSTAPELVDAVRHAIEGFSSDPRRDDVAILVVRVPREM